MSHQSQLRRRGLLAAALTVATVLAPMATSAPAFAAACHGADADPAQATRHELTRTTLCLVNRVRSSRSLARLRLDPRLSRAASEHSLDMVRRRYFSHTTPEGVSFLQRIAATGYLGGPGRWVIGENLAWGTGPDRGAPRRIVRGWMHSPPHREELLRPSFRNVGIGVVLGAPVPSGTAGATYTVDFGVKHSRHVTGRSLVVDGGNTLQEYKGPPDAWY
jgi:uncharacterized protein YkwD